MQVTPCAKDWSFGVKKFNAVSFIFFSFEVYDHRHIDRKDFHNLFEISLQGENSRKFFSHKFQ